MADQVDRLGVIARWEYTIYVCDVCGQDADQADFPICPNCNSDRALKLVKVVPAEQLRGAVEAAREQIKALIMAQSAAGYVETAGWALLLDEIDKLPTPGGQSSPAGCPACSPDPRTARPPHTCSEEQS